MVVMHQDYTLVTQMMKKIMTELMMMPSLVAIANQCHKVRHSCTLQYCTLS